MTRMLVQTSTLCGAIAIALHGLAAAAPSASTIDFPTAPTATAPMGATDETDPPLRAAPRSAIPAAAAPAAVPASKSGNPLWGMPLRSLNVTRERPIFVPSRRPPVVNAPVAFAPPPPPPPPPPTMPDRPPLSLLGTVSAERDSIAVFFDQGTRNVVRLRIGQAHMGWVLRSISGRSVALQRNDVTETLTLQKPGDRPRALPINGPGASNLPVLPLRNPSAPADDESNAPIVDMR